MYPQKTDTDRLHGIDDSYPYRLINFVLSDGKKTQINADLIPLFISEWKAEYVNPY